MRFNHALLRSMRASRKMTRRALSDAAGIAEHTIWKIESETTKVPSMPIVAALAGVFGVEPMAFFDLSTHSGNNEPAA